MVGLKRKGNRMHYFKVSNTCMDINSWRVVKDIDHYAIVEPGYAIPYGWDWCADCPTQADAIAEADEMMDSDRMFAEM